MVLVASWLQFDSLYFEVPHVRSARIRIHFAAVLIYFGAVQRRLNLHGQREKEGGGGVEEREWEREREREREREIKREGEVCVESDQDGC